MIQSSYDCLVNGVSSPKIDGQGWVAERWSDGEAHLYSRQAP